MKAEKMTLCKTCMADMASHGKQVAEIYTGRELSAVCEKCGYRRFVRHYEVTNKHYGKRKKAHNDRRAKKSN